MAYCAHAHFRALLESSVMTKKTCAACDYPLDANSIEVKIGGRTVEVCCDECAQKLHEAQASAAAVKRSATAAQGA